METAELRTADCLREAMFDDFGVKSLSAHVQVELALGDGHRDLLGPLPNGRDGLDKAAAELVHGDLRRLMNLAAVQLLEHFRDVAMRVHRRPPRELAPPVHQ